MSHDCVCEHKHHKITTCLFSFNDKSTRHVIVRIKNYVVCDDETTVMQIIYEIEIAGTTNVVLTIVTEQCEGVCSYFMLFYCISFHKQTMMVSILICVIAIQTIQTIQINTHSFVVLL